MTYNEFTCTDKLLFCVNYILNMKFRLDATDMLILYHLRSDGRMSLTNLGKILELTPAAVTYRLNKLIDSNVIKMFTIEINSEMLTPNYQSYNVNVCISRSYQSKLIEEFSNSGLFERSYELASSDNFMGITYHLSKTQMKDLIDLLKKEGVMTYNITPIVTQYVNISKLIVGEDIHDIYCPLCQKKIADNTEGIISEINNKTFVFCCTSCLEEFKQKYLELSGEL